MLEDSIAVKPDVLVSSGTRRWLYISFPLLVSFAVAQLVKTSMGIVAASPEFIDRFHVGPHSSAVGWASSSFLYAYGVAMLGWGYLVKRIGPRRAMLLGSGIWVLALAVTPFVHTIPQLYGTRIALGAGEACFYPVAHTLTARWFPIQERARANASWLSGIFVGSTVASSLTAVSLTSLGWAGAFWLQAGIALVLAFGVSLLLIRDDPRGTTAVGSAEVTHIEENRFENTNLIPKAGSQSPYRNYRYWLTMLMYLGTNIPFYGLVTWLPLYLREQRHISFGMVGLILTAANALSIVVMIGVSMWSDRRMRRASVAAAGFAVEAIGILGAVLFPENTLVIGVWAFLGLAGNAWCIVANWGLLHSLMPTEEVEHSSGVFACLTNLAGAGAPALIGWLLSTTGSYTPGFLFLVATIVVSIACCAVLIPQRY
jgi:MFS family permease